MSEQISRQAKNLYDEHKKLAKDQITKKFMIHGLARNLLIAESSKIDGEKPKYNKEFLETDIARRERELNFVANESELQVDRAKRFADANLGTLTNQAAEEATAAGKEIVLQQAEDHGQQIPVRIPEHQ